MKVQDYGSTQPLFESGLGGVQAKALVAALIGVVLLVLGALTNRTQFFMSYLTGYMFWSGMGLGFLLLLMLHNATGGIWGRPIRTYLEAGSRTVPIMALFFIPIFFGVHSLYSWLRPEVQAELEGWDTKGHYLNLQAWTFRTILYFVIWISFVYLMKKWNTPRARTGEEEHGKLQTISCLGLLVFFITMSFASIDWYMSLEPEWFSSIFGVILIVGQGMSAYAWCVVFTRLVAKGRSMEVIPVKPLHDLGNFLLMATMLWAYTSFSQYLLIWSGQIPEETSWLIHRAHGMWGWVGFTLIMAHFFLPFFCLLFRSIKRRLQNLFWVALLLILVHMLHDVWVVAPAFRASGPFVHWMDIGAFLGLGGVWVALFVQQVKNIGPSPLVASPAPSAPTGGPVDRPHTARRPDAFKPVGA